MMGLQRKQRYVRCIHVENLENRQLYSVVTATPQNFMGVIQSSSAGETISFTPGNYVVSPNAVVFAAGRNYVGNGAVFSLNSGVDHSNTENVVTVNGGTSASNATQVSGFVFTDSEMYCRNGSCDIHNNEFTNASDVGLLTINVSNSQFNNNYFTNLANAGIYGYPGNNNTYDNNYFNNVYEGIHLYASQNNTDVSGNILSGITRFGIELQGAMTNLAVNNNWMGNWNQQGTGNNNSHIAISCATGYGNNIEITGNTLLNNGKAENINVWACAAMEVMGSNVLIANNVAWNYGTFILDGLEGANRSTGNQVYGTGLSSNDNVGNLWRIVPVSSVNDHVGISDNALVSLPSSPSTANDGLQGSSLATANALLRTGSSSSSTVAASKLLRPTKTKVSRVVTADPIVKYLPKIPKIDATGFPSLTQ